MRRTRARSFSFVARTSTMRFPKVLPIRTIETVEIVLSTSFCAVPAFSRVEPASNSGPTTTAISCSDRGRRAWSRRRRRLQRSARRRRRPPRCAPSDVRRPPAGADRRHGVVEPRPMPPRRPARRPRHRPRQRRARRRSPTSAPATSATTCAGGSGERRLALGRVERRDRARGARADVDQAAAALEALDDGVDRRRRARRGRRGDGRGTAASARFISSTSSSRGREVEVGLFPLRLGDQAV